MRPSPARTGSWSRPRSAQLAPAILHKLRTSVADGVEASRWVKGFESEWIETAAQHAFLSGLELGMAVAGGVALAVLAIVLLALPSRPANAPPQG